MIALILKILFSITALGYGTVLVRDVLKTNMARERGSFVTSGAIGGLVYFLDTLGIGSFAPATALLRAFKQVPDRLLPGTLNAMCTIPTLVEALIFIGMIQVDFITLISMVIASSIGGWLGAHHVCKLPEQKIRFAMTGALFITATFMLLNRLNLLPAATHDAIGLSGIKLVIAMIMSLAVGALGSIGIGFYAPCLATLYLLGMSAKATFPIMMSCCAAYSTVIGLKFITAGKYNRKVTIAMISVAIIGVIIAAYIVKSLPLNNLMWIVIIVIYYTAASLFWTFYKSNE